MSSTSASGSLQMADGSIYHGDYIMSTDSDGHNSFVAHGAGRYVNSSGDLFVGQYRDGKRVIGKMIIHTGSIYEGSFDENELPYGPGSFTLTDGRSYEGTFGNNRIHGRGVFSNFVEGCQLVKYDGV